MFSRNVDMLKGNILKTLIIFAIPILISSLFQQLYNTIDIMIVGHYLGETSLAAIGSSGAIYELLVGFALGVGNGLSIVTSRAYGSDNKKLVKKSVAASLVIGVGLTIVMMIIGQVFLYPLLELVNTPVDIIKESYSYIYVISMSVGVMFLYNLAAGLLRSIGNSMMPLIFLIISSVINIILDIVFITSFDMGIKGAALATVVAQGISGVLCILYILKKTEVLMPGKEHFVFDKALYKDLLGQGLSMGVMLLIVSVGTVVLQTSINGFGHIIIAGHTAARKVGGFAMMPIIALSMSLATFVSQNKGANQGKRIRKAIFLTNIAELSLGVIVTIISLIFAPILMRVISGSSDVELISIGSKYMMVNAAFYAVLGILLNYRNGLQGIGEKVLPLFSSVIEFIVKILFVLLVIPKLGYFGVIICEPIIWCLMLIQLAIAFYRNSYIRESKVSLKEILQAE
ncbi:MATE family efflux transporter [uncultured Clostridium sp.]|uniref:MATE family efflux transporter n=1 Tax=uncultured Clostridium sp. TaxID=59620 RepID=UPI002618F7B6|nr:MATE family efflux transporter [uncultured Clostridium sp.]